MGKEEIAVFVLLFVITIIMVVWNGFLLSERIHPSNYPAAIGDYGIQTRKSASVLQKCNANNPCVFPAESLQSAIDQCDSRAEICKSFIYSDVNNSMSIIDDSKPLEKGTDNVFTRQIMIFQ